MRLARFDVFVSLSVSLSDADSLFLIVADGRKHRDPYCAPRSAGVSFCDLPGLSRGQAGIHHDNNEFILNGTSC